MSDRKLSPEEEEEIGKSFLRPKETPENCREAETIDVMFSNHIKGLQTTAEEIKKRTQENIDMPGFDITGLPWYIKAIECLEEIRKHTPYALRTHKLLHGIYDEKD